MTCERGAERGRALIFSFRRKNVKMAAQGRVAYGEYPPQGLIFLTLWYYRSPRKTWHSGVLGLVQSSQSCG